MVLFFSLTSGQNTNAQVNFASPNCAGAMTFASFPPPSSGSCVQGRCNNLAFSTSQQNICFASTPNIPANFVRQTFFTGPGCTTPVATYAAAPNVCVPYSDGVSNSPYSLRMICSNGAAVYTSYFNSDCSGIGSSRSATPTCAIVAAGIYGTGSCPASILQSSFFVLLLVLMVL